MTEQKEDADAEPAVTAALDAFRAQYRDAEASIEAIPDPQRAFDRATELRDVADALVGEAAALRARMAYQIYQSEEMSLSTLADRISVSKTRADQFIRTARAENPKEDK